MFVAQPTYLLAMKWVALRLGEEFHDLDLISLELSIVSGLRYAMSAVRRYLAEIGRRGGMRSRRTLTPEIARRMVQIREARRIANRASTAERLGGTAADTTAAAQAIQDGLLQRTSPAEKLAQVARLSRMVDQLSMAGVRQRHVTVDDEMIRYLRAELRLGRELAARVYGARRDVA